MPDKVFADTNLWVYLFLRSEHPEDQQKKQIVQTLLKTYPEIIVSNQVLNEIANVLLKRYHIDRHQVEQYLRELLTIADVILLDKENTFDALRLMEKYSLSFYDALIVSAAKDAWCSLLFSEDMSDGQQIENVLTIRNPFNTP